ncbi:MAG: twin-arginine translocase TatA/TatE family subunit [Actinomycetaceae bacterium]
MFHPPTKVTAMFRNGLQPMHIIVLVVVILLVFGASRLPDIASSIGKSLKVFKKEVRELRDDDPGSGAAGGGQSTTGGDRGATSGHADGSGTHGASNGDTPGERPSGDASTRQGPPSQTSG